MSDSTQTLDKDKILSTHARRVLFQGLMENLSIAEAAQKADLDVKYAQNYVAKSGIKALVKAEQQAIEAKTAEKLHISAERVLLEYARIAFADPAQMYDGEGKLKPIHEIPEDVRRAISTLETTQKGSKARTWSKTDALAALSKHLGLFQADREPPENLASKALAAATMRDLRAIADEWLRRNYQLSANDTKLIDSTEVQDTQALTNSQNEPESDIEGQAQDVGGVSGEKSAIFEADPPMPPKGPGPEVSTLPPHNTEDF